MSATTVDPNPTKAAPMTALDWALKLAGWGLRIFPLKPDKTPAHTGWQEEATTDPEIIREWLDSSTLYGILADGDLVVVDLDRKKGKDGVRALANACSKAGLDVDSFPTFTVRSPSGGGLHLYFRSTEEIRYGADMLGPGSGVDVRSQGKGYVVGPGSVYAEKVYQVTEDQPIADMGTLASIFPKGDPEPRPVNRTPLPGVDPTRALERARVYLAAAPVAVEGLGGDNLTYKIACRLKDLGVDQAQAVFLMDELWNERCAPPWSLRDLAKKVDNAYRFGQEPQGSAAPEAAFPAAPDPEPEEGGAPADKALGRARVVYVAANLVQTVDDMESAILGDPDRGPVFSFAGGYVTVRQSKPVTVRDLAGGDYPPMALIDHFDPHSMLERLTRSVWLQRQDRKGEWKPAAIPLDLVRMLLSRHGGNAPALTGIIEAPTIRQDGSVLSQEGYDAATGLLAVFNGSRFPDIAASPSQVQAQEALRFIEDEVFAEFPFANPLDRTGAAAALVTGLVRHALGIAPAFLISAPTQSTGKTALTHTIGHGAFGRPPAASAWPANEAEMGKFLLATLKEGQRAVVFDNIKDGSVVDSSQLAAAITSEKYTSRVLGVSDTATVPTSVLWLLTGNNVRLAGDMPTRVLRLYLDSKEERPDRRSFHRDLIPWVTQHRPRIVAAVLVIVRAYLAAGCPRIVNTVTRFPAWDRLVRLPLIHAGGQDVALKFDDAFTDDPVLSAWADVLEAWHDCFGAEAMRLSDVVDRMEAHSLGAVRTPGEVFDSGRTDKAARLKEALKLALNDPRRGEINPGSLGKRLAQYENRPLGGMKLVRVIDTHTKGNRWAVRPTG